MVGESTAKLQESKHVWTRGTDSKLCQTSTNYERERNVSTGSLSKRDL